MYGVGCVGFWFAMLKNVYAVRRSTKLCKQQDPDKRSAVYVFLCALSNLSSDWSNFKAFLRSKLLCLGLKK